MANKIESLERALLTKALLDAGKSEELKEILEEVIEEARSTRYTSKAAKSSAMKAE